MRDELPLNFSMLGLKNALWKSEGRCVLCKNYISVVQASIMGDIRGESVEKVDFSLRMLS